MTRARCGREVDVYGGHALHCPLGGGPTRRHHAVRGALARWLRSVGHHAVTEQVIDGWETADGQAVLDVVYRLGARGRTCLDVSLVDAANVARIGRNYKYVLRRREREKHLRYPHAGMVPFVLDNRGRWGGEAETWLRQVLSEVPEEERNDARCRLRATIAHALQSQIAEQFALAVEHS